MCVYRGLTSPLNSFYSSSKKVVFCPNAQQLTSSPSSMPSVKKQNVTSRGRTRTDLWSSQAKDPYHGIGRLLRSETGNFLDMCQHCAVITCTFAATIIRSTSAWVSGDYLCLTNIYSRQFIFLWPICRDSRDPRFENLSGKFSTDQFRKQYAFVYDEALPEEKRDLRNQMQVRHVGLH